MVYMLVRECPAEGVVAKEGTEEMVVGDTVPTMVQMELTLR